MTGERVSAMGGGVADKLGNRYEGWWTIWRGVVPVLRGHYDAIQVEVPGLPGEAAEFRLYGHQPSGPDQVHQCKRSRAASWTLTALRTEGLLDPFERHLRQGTEVVFASGKACVLENLSDKARRLSLEDWTATFTDPEEADVDTLIDAWKADHARVHSLLRGFTFHLINDHPLRDAAIGSLETQVTGDPKNALLFLGDLLNGHVSTRLTAQFLWSALQDEGYRPRDGYDHSSAVTVREVSERYIEGVRRRRPQALPLIVRPEVEQLISALKDPAGGPGVVVAGAPGAGKTTALAEVCARLAADGVVVGALRLDVTDASHSARQLGTQDAVGFGASPSAVLERAAAGEPSVLVIDQLDALSRFSGQGESPLGGVRELLETARASGDMRLLVACRRYDLANDRQLKGLLGDFEVIDLGPLSDEHVRDALMGLGVDPTGLSVRQRTLLSSPFALRLLAEMVSDSGSDERAAFDITRATTLTQLLDAFDGEMRRRLNQRLGVDNYARGISAFARRLSGAGSLSVPRSVIGEPGQDTLDALIGEGVLVEDRGRVRFFHEEYFDYAFARQHIQASGSAVSLIQGKSQDLLCRRLVRAVLSLEHELGLDQYREDLQDILANATDYRSHIRAAVLTWLKSLAPVESYEFEHVANLALNSADPLTRNAMPVLVSSGFVPHLLAHGLVDSITAGFHGDADRSGAPTNALTGFTPDQTRWMLTEAARVSPEEICAGLVPVARDPSIAVPWTRMLLWTVFLAGSTAGEATVDLYCATATTVGNSCAAMAGATAGENTSAQTVQGTAIAALFGSDGFHALSTLAGRTSAPVATALRAWLETRAQVARASGARNAFDYSAFPPREGTGLRIFQRAAERDPVAFLENLTQPLLAEFDEIDFEVRWHSAGTPDDHGPGLRYRGIGTVVGLSPDLEGEVVEGLRTALRLAAAEHPVEGALYLEQFTSTDLLLAHQLAASAFSQCAPELYPAALAWASRDGVRGLPLNSTVAWAWGEVLAHLADAGAESVRESAVALAIEPYASLDLDAASTSVTSSSSGDTSVSRDQQLALEQLVALSLIERRIGARFEQPARERLAQLTESFGPAPTASDAWVHRLRGEDSESEPGPLTDDQWIEVIENHGHSPVRLGTLESVARSEPARFARFVTARIGPQHDHQCTFAVLRGIGSALDLPADGILSAIVDVVATVSGWGVEAFNRPLCSLLDKLAGAQLPERVLAWVVAVATTAVDPSPRRAPEPGEEHATTGLNSDRGAAAYCIAQLLGPEEHRTERLEALLPAIRSLVVDDADQVRVWCPVILTRVHLSDPGAASEMSRSWLSLADDAQFVAPYLDRLTWQLLHSDAELGLILVQRMLEADSPDACRRGGALAAMTAFLGIGSLEPDRRPHPQDVFEQSLRDAASRSGVAEALAVRVEDLPQASQASDTQVNADEGLLVRLLDDEDQAVREAAIGFVRHMNGSPIKRERLLTALVPTLAFADFPQDVFHALDQAGAELPVAASLSLCETWLSAGNRTVGDISTRDAAIALEVADVVLSLYASTRKGGSERERTLDLLDSLVEAGAIDIDRKTDEWASQ
ncbi:AAA family ATPase [Streptomyces lasiicapitis]|uniref:AAA family ATPase n=1 Tax=Streptomyces lasiicapitis TaxID=1923961 RepID=UPI00367BE46E